MAGIAQGDLAPRLLFVPLAVLSPGPRLAGTPSKGKGNESELGAANPADARMLCSEYEPVSVAERHNLLHHVKLCARTCENQEIER
jgi:hypothetical protein